MVIWKFRHLHQNRHQHQHCKKSIFAFRKLFLKKKKNIQVFPSAQLSHQYHFVTNTCFSAVSYSSIQRFSFVFQKKTVFGSIHPLGFQNRDCSESFCILSIKTFSVESGLSTLAGLPGTFTKNPLEQLFYGELVSACFRKEEPHNTRYLRNFPEL